MVKHRGISSLRVVGLLVTLTWVGTDGAWIPSPRHIVPSLAFRRISWYSCCKSELNASFRITIDRSRQRNRDLRCRPLSRRTTRRQAILAIGGVDSTITAAATSHLVAVTSQHSQFLVRILFLRAMAFVYAIAFLIALNQNKALIGDGGITPARHVLDRAQDRGRLKRERRIDWRKSSNGLAHKVSVPPPSITPNQGKKSHLLLQLQRRLRLRLQRRIGAVIDQSPRLVRLREVLWDRTDALDRPLTTLLWLARDRSNLNPWLDGIARTGLLLSVAVLALGCANVPLILAIWICQRSLMAVGGPWCGFGWEPQLAEVAFHAMFLVPVFQLRQFPHHMPVPAMVAWTIRWHLFRIMIGAGLIKFRSGDKKWKDLTAMNYFYETQPVPNPLSRYFHWLPPVWHKVEVVLNHFVEVVAPWLLIVPGLPRAWRRTGGILQLVFQATLICSGNLSFLNWLTMVPAIMCLDDELIGKVFFSQTMQLQAAKSACAYSNLPLPRQVVSTSFLLLILWLSIPVVRNLLSKRQIMNSSFDPLRLVNTYGAFGTVDEERYEYIISSATNWDGEWREYEFKAKPGDVYRSPRFVSPYHYRLDWQIWIATTAGKSLDRSPWMFTFLRQLLVQDPHVLGLLRDDPWRDGPVPPKYIRVDLYQYQFHHPQRNEKDPPYWNRTLIRRVYPRQGLATIDSIQADIDWRR